MQLPKGPSSIVQKTRDAAWRKVSTQTQDEESRIRQTMRVYPDKLRYTKAAPRTLAVSGSGS